MRRICNQEDDPLDEYSYYGSPGREGGKGDNSQALAGETSRAVRTLAGERAVRASEGIGKVTVGDVIGYRFSRGSGRETWAQSDLQRTVQFKRSKIILTHRACQTWNHFHHTVTMSRYEVEWRRERSKGQEEIDEDILN